jgi:hypothetical protein
MTLAQILPWRRSATSAVKPCARSQTSSREVEPFGLVLNSKSGQKAEKTDGLKSGERHPDGDAPRYFKRWLASSRLGLPTDSGAPPWRSGMRPCERLPVERAVPLVEGLGLLRD